MATRPLARKLGMKAGMRIAIINPPEGYLKLLGKIPPAGESIIEHPGRYDFIHIFVRNREDIRRFCTAAISTLAEDGHLWFSYPKKSGSLTTDLTRDEGWDVLKVKKGYRPVAAVSIDDDWSALRFRPSSKVKRTVMRSKCVDPVRRTVSLPADFSKMLRKDTGASVIFRDLSFTQRKECVLWIESARKPETRALRIRKTIETLRRKSVKQ